MIRNINKKRVAIVKRYQKNKSNSKISKQMDKVVKINPWITLLLSLIIPVFVYLRKLGEFSKMGIPLHLISITTSDTINLLLVYVLIIVALYVFWTSKVRDIVVKIFHIPMFVLGIFNLLVYQMCLVGVIKYFSIFENLFKHSWILVITIGFVVPILAIILSYNKELTKHMNSLFMKNIVSWSLVFMTLVYSMVLVLYISMPILFNEYISLQKPVVEMIVDTEETKRYIISAEQEYYFILQELHENHYIKKGKYFYIPKDEVKMIVEAIFVEVKE